jgi:hypothetical protein
VTVEASKKIRAALKAKGYSKAEVSVYNQSYSLGSTVYVTIKQAAIPLATIEEIAKVGERVDRDSATGEILGGGNCFVDVRYGDGVLDEQAKRINQQVAGERRIFGRFSLYPKDPFTWQVCETTADGAGRMSMHLDRKEPGAGLARILASAGLLSVLHDGEPGEPCPECGGGPHEGLCAGPEPIAAVLPANDRDDYEQRWLDAERARGDAERRLEQLELAQRASAVAREMTPAPLMVEGAAPHELAALRACLDSFAGQVEADRWSLRQALETMAQAAFALGRSGR